MGTSLSPCPPAPAVAAALLGYSGSQPAGELVRRSPVGSLPVLHPQRVRRVGAGPWRGAGQGLTLVHISGQRKHILWDTLGARFSPSLLDRGARGAVTETA